MSNNKQSSVEWLAEQLTAKMQMWNSTKNYQEFHIVLEAGEFANLIEQAKAMHEEEMKNFTEDWYHNGPLLGVGIDVKNTIEQHFNNTYGGGDK